MTRFAEAPSVVDSDVMVAMRDGVRLATDVYRRDALSPLPTVVVRTPYDKSAIQVVLNVPALVAAGYAVVVQDCRGLFASEGDFVPFLREGPDGSDTVEWAAAQPWSSGQVAMVGPSYLGVTQWTAAFEHPPHLIAISPATTPATFFDGAPWARPGILALETACMWTALQAQQIALRTGVDAGAVSALPALEELTGIQLGLPDETHAAERATRIFESLFRHRPQAQVPDFAQAGHWYADWATDRGTDDPYWQQVAPASRYRELDLPALHVTGWYDAFLDATINNFLGLSEHSVGSTARRHQRLVIGPWTHSLVGAAYGGNDLLAMLPDPPAFLADFVPMDGFVLLEWLDAVMKGEKPTAAATPRIRIYVMGEGKWRDEAEWPLARTRWTKYFLHSDGDAAGGDGGRLSLDPPEDQAADSYSYDPTDPVPTVGGAGLNLLRPLGAVDQREVERRPDVAVYTSEPLAAATEVTGPISVDLWASSTALDADFTAKLVDVHPDGRALNLASGIVRASVAGEGTASAVMTEPTLLRITLSPTSNRFAVGHRIRLEISSSDYPQYEQNPFPGEQSLFHDASRPSCVTLPVIPLNR